MKLEEKTKKIIARHVITGTESPNLKKDGTLIIVSGGQIFVSKLKDDIYDRQATIEIPRDFREQYQKLLQDAEKWVEKNLSDI